MTKDDSSIPSPILSPLRDVGFEIYRLQIPRYNIYIVSEVQPEDCQPQIPLKGIVGLVPAPFAQRAKQANIK
jgi:hypothetical protein